MADPYKHQRRGDPLSRFSVRAYNKMLDAIKPPASGANHPGFTAGFGFGDLVQVRNETGAIVRQFGIVAIDEPIILPSDNEPQFRTRLAMRGAMPAAGDRGKFAVLLDRADEGQIVQAMLSGVIAVRIDIGHASHGFADIKSGSSEVLASAAFGSARILWKESGTGEGKWAWIRFGETPQGSLIPVTLTADGGADGTLSTVPTYTYKWPVHLVTGVEIMKADGTRATGLAPEWARDVGEFNQATHGLLYIDDEGNPALFQVDEIEKVCE